MSELTDWTAIFPVYNEQENLPFLFEQLKVPFFEKGVLLFVDDASSDSSFEQLLAFRAKKKRVGILQHRKRRGQQSALLTGIAFATTPILFLADADAEWDITIFEKMLPLLKTYSLVLTYRKERAFVRKLPSFFFNRLFLPFRFSYLVKDIASPVKALRKEVAEKVLKKGGFPSFIPEMKDLPTCQVPLSPLRKKKKSHYSFFSLSLLFFATFFSRKWEPEKKPRFYPPR